MTPQRWQKVKKILSRAAAFKQLSQRQTYLQERCGPSTRAEVDALLSAQEKNGDFLSAYSSLAGKTLLHYQLLEKAGQGAMATVYKAHDTHLRRFVVLKVLSPLLAADPEAVRRFIQEAQCASSLSHPNIVTVHEIGRDKGATFIVMEYVPGKTLDRAIPRRGLAPGTCLDYAIQMAAALIHAHSAGIIHRDLKPSNILVTQEGMIKVVDFGLAKAMKPAPQKAADGAKTLAGSILGTAGYMAPEQVRAQIADARSDIFSFGAIFYEMLTGQRAFKRESSVETMAAILNENPPPVAKRYAPGVSEILRRCLEKDPQKRFQTAQYLADALQAARTPTTMHALRKRSAARRAEHHVFAGVLGIFLLAVLGGLTLWPSHQYPAPHIIVLVAPFEGPDAVSGLTKSIFKDLRQVTERYGDVEVRLLRQPIRSNQDPFKWTGEAQQRNANLVIWGKITRTAQHAMITYHVAAIGDPAIVPLRRGTNSADLALSELDSFGSPVRLVASAIRFSTLTVLGAIWLEAHDNDRAIRVLTQALAELGLPEDVVDPDIARFYRGLAYQRRIDAIHCLQKGSPGCEMNGAISDRKASAADFEVVLQSRPRHAGSCWNQALAYSSLCELQSRTGDWASALSSCDHAIFAFGEALRPGPMYGHFFQSLPDEADVLWNRGLTHLVRARIEGLTAEAQLADLRSALNDFDHLLAGGTRYATFLNKRRPDVLRSRAAADHEQAELASKAALLRY